MFNTNEKGGWIIPAETAVASGTHIPDCTEIGDDCNICLLYTSDAADDLLCVELGGRRNLKKQKHNLFCRLK